MDAAKTTRGLTPKEVVEQFEISRSHFFKRVKDGDFVRLPDNTFDPEALRAGGLRERAKTLEDDPKTSEESPETPLAMGIVLETIQTLREQLTESHNRETQLLKQLEQSQVLLAREQENFQRLLPAAIPAKQGMLHKLKGWWAGAGAPSGTT